MFISTVTLLLLSVVMPTISGNVSVTNAKSDRFELHKGMRGVYCSDHATGTGTAESTVACGTRCHVTEGCTGFFYNRYSRVCTVVKVIAIPHYGCRPETGTNYYVKLVSGLFDGYAGTTADRALVDSGAETQSSVCTRHHNHVFYTDVGATEKYGCTQGITCCKTKGCYPGTADQYTGTWSRTVSGRPCQFWDQQTPHAQQYYLGKFPAGETYVDAYNYCRDPELGGNLTGYLWCYTADPSVRWESCGIPRC